jgi:hypothetical protein
MILQSKQDYVDYIKSINYKHLINVDIKIPHPYCVEIILTVPFWFPFCFGKYFKDDLNKNLNKYKWIYVSHTIKFKTI